MTCAVHTDTEAAGYCRNCGKAMCAQCTREVSGTFYCQDCLGALIAAPRAVENPAIPEPSIAAITPNANPHPDARHVSHPGVALALGFIPGLGAVYNGEYIKGLVHVAIFGGIIAALNTQMPEGYEAFLGIVLSCFYLYMPIDAYRTARSRLANGPDAIETGDPGPVHKPTGAIVMIVIGVLFLLGNLGWLDREWIGKGWPIVLIALGIWMLWERLGKNS